MNTGKRQSDSKNRNFYVVDFRKNNYFYNCEKTEQSNGKKKIFTKRVRCNT